MDAKNSSKARIVMGPRIAMDTRIAMDARIAMNVRIAMEERKLKSHNVFLSYWLDRAGKPTCSAALFCTASKSHHLISISCRLLES
jgi:hypothetical protein